MKISYNWLNKYLPGNIAGDGKLEPQRLSTILTSVGLEVESLEFYESIKGSLAGLIVGEVISTKPHPNANKLTIAKVAINNDGALQIVCGAHNVAAGQKVIVAPVGSVIYPLNKQPFTINVASIRGEDSFGMICAEDEIGVGDDHSGIFVLPPEAKKGSPASDYFNVYTDWIYEIGLTPNRMDAMSHIGVAKDVCAWVSHQTGKPVKANLPYSNSKPASPGKGYEVIIENVNDCRRYSALHIGNVTVGESPAWLQNLLRAIGQRPINNIVDITNFVLHETGQPLHAFDADAISAKKVAIKNLSEGTLFKTLDEVERKLSSRDLMICNGDEPVCIAGVFGGIGSGVTERTKNIFLESAWFNPTSIRETSFRHGLRTEAAVRFEKGVDISGTAQALTHAAELMKEIAGGEITSDVIDNYPSKIEKKQIVLRYDYLKKLSGKDFTPDAVKKIITALEFDVLDENNNELLVAAPLSKMDIALPADVVEEIVRIDGLDNIKIPQTITISPSTDGDVLKELLKEKLSQLLVGLGFNEINTNSISNSRNFDADTRTVSLLNNLSAELDIMRPSMLETGLEILAYNINRKNSNLRLFEFGKTYHKEGTSSLETEQFCFWMTAKNEEKGWKHRNSVTDFFMAKGIVEKLLSHINISGVEFSEARRSKKGVHEVISNNGSELGKILQVDPGFSNRFDVRQAVIFTQLNYDTLLNTAKQNEIIFREIPQIPKVERDLAVVISKDTSFADLEKVIKQTELPFLQQFHLFDIFESEKIGMNMKSLALNFTFLNAEKTLTDGEVETLMQMIIKKLETELKAEVRK